MWVFCLNSVIWVFCRRGYCRWGFCRWGFCRWGFCHVGFLSVTRPLGRASPSKRAEFMIASVSFVLTGNLICNFPQTGEISNFSLINPKEFETMQIIFPRQSWNCKLIP